MSVTKFTIDRSRWWRGAGGIASLLRRIDGSQCCLGFAGEAFGVPDRCLRGVPMPRLPAMVRSGEGTGSHLWPDWFFELRGTHPGDDWRSVLADINDAPYLSATEREKEIARIFAAYGVEVEFVG